MSASCPEKAICFRHMRLWETCVKDVYTNRMVFTLAQAPSQGFLSMPSRPHLLVTRPHTNTPIATIQTGSFSTSSITIALHGQQLKLSSASLTRRKWGYKPNTTPCQQPWVWQRDKSERVRAVMLTDKKSGGRVIARIRGDTLMIDATDLSRETWEEVVMTAVALADHVRRQRKHGFVLDVGGAIVSGGDGGSSGYSGGGDGGSGGDGGGDGGDGGGGCS